MIKHLVLIISFCTYATTSCMSLFSISFKPNVTLSLPRTPVQILEEASLPDAVKQALNRLDVTYTERDIRKLATPATLPTINQIIKRKRALNHLAHKAIDRDDKAAVMQWIENQDTHINARYQGETALIHALNKKRFEIARLLLAQGANPDITEDRTGNSSLHVAARMGNLALVTELVDTYKADIHAKNKKGLSALFVAPRGAISKYLYTHPNLTATEKNAYKTKYPSAGSTLLATIIPLLVVR